MYLRNPIFLSTPTICFAFILIGWQRVAFWIICLITVMQIIFSYLLPQYWVGWKRLVKQGILISLGVVGMCIAVQIVPAAPVLLLAIFVQTISQVVFA